MPHPWWRGAACANEDPELFFPVSSAGPAARERERAKAVCRRCVVADDCLDWALRLGRPAGIWGGLDEEERAALRRRRLARRGKEHL
ncbi:WhiB family transcriptional regulator [Streptomyces sp. NPDC051940]|uniref:WhiB family transcriptional regulator n=1 Tax=Streptomyces sp. NPDC051940 TaxID=3155675 RepID=UPI003414DF5D